MTESPMDPKALAAASPRFVHTMPVRFQDVDAAGIVFFSRLFDYFHDAYVAFLEHRGLGLPGVLRRAEWGLPLRHAEADFLVPLAFGDVVDVGLVRAAWKESNLIIGYRATLRTSTRGKAGSVAAVGCTHHVVVGGGMERPRRLAPPSDLVEAFAMLVSPANTESPPSLT